MKYMYIKISYILFKQTRSKSRTSAHLRGLVEKQKDIQAHPFDTALTPDPRIAESPAGETKDTCNVDVVIVR